MPNGLRLHDHRPHRVASFEHLGGARALSLGDRHPGGARWRGRAPARRGCPGSRARSGWSARGPA